MKLGDTGLDDLLNEAQFALQDDGRRCALVLLWLLTWAYSTLKTAMLVALRLPWRLAPRFPELGAEPFNLADAELEREWSQH